MRTFTTLRIPAALLARLSDDAREQETRIGRHASLCVAAAGRLYALDSATSAVPREPVVGHCAAEVGLALDMRDVEVLAEAAREHGMTLQRQLVAILDAAATLPVVTPRRPSRQPAVPKRPAFDPKFYAAHSVAFR